MTHSPDQFRPWNEGSGAAGALEAEKCRSIGNKSARETRLVRALRGAG
jgi:hypothetical protein